MNPGNPPLAIEFWSAVGAHPFQRALMDCLTAEGVVNSEHCSVSQKEYREARGPGARIGLRLRTYLKYPFEIACRFRRASPGTSAVISSNTFFAPWVALHAGPPDLAVVHWVLDLYPDALIAARKVGRHSRVARGMRRVMRVTFNRASANVFLGRRLLAHAEKEFGPIPRAHVIPIGADGRAFANAPPENRPAVCRVLYCGNFGHLHEVDTLTAALKAELPVGLEFEFRGNGAAMINLARAAIASSRVRFGPNLPDGAWAEAMKQADVALVTMREGAESVVLPSKAYSALVAGQAILAICPIDSDLADLVKAHDAGWVIPPGDPRALVDLLQRIVGDATARLAKRRNAWHAGHACYDQAILAKEWCRVLRTLPARA